MNTSLEGSSIFRRALALGWRDFEDAVCAAAAEAAGCELLVTRGPGGCRDSPVLVVDPVTALALLKGTPGPGEVAERPLPGYGRRPSGRQRA